MGFPEEFKRNIIHKGPENFVAAALQLFRFQSQHNTVYKDYLTNLSRDTEQVHQLNQIPFLPIEFFKTHAVQSQVFTPKVVFRSSGTTLQQRSQHLVADPEFYKQHAQQLFEETYGPLTGCVVLALLPSYLEQGDSSLVMMIDHFIKTTGQSQAGFYLRNHEELRKTVREAKAQKKEGVSLWRHLCPVRFSRRTWLRRFFRHHHFRNGRYERPSTGDGAGRTT